MYLLLGDGLFYDYQDTDWTSFGVYICKTYARVYFIINIIENESLHFEHGNKHGLNEK